MKKHFLLSALFVFTMSVVLSAGVLAADYEFQYSECANGIVDRLDTALTTSHTESDSTKCLIVYPKPSGADAAAKPVVIDSYSWESKAIPMQDVEYIEIQYKYTGSSDKLGQPEINILRNSGKYLSQSKSIQSYESKLTSGSDWQTLTFDVKRELKGLVKSNGYLLQMHFYPYGKVTANNFSSVSDQLHIGKIRFISSKEPTNKKYKITYEKGFPKAYLKSGAAPTSVYIDKGASLTLPSECQYAFEDFSFDGWICYLGNKKYNAGADFGSVTCDLQFTADWYNNTSVNTEYRYLNFVDVANGFVNNKNYGTISKNVTFDGVPNLLQFIPNSTLTNTVASIDSFEWLAQRISLDTYKYMSVVYYYKTNNPPSNPKLQWLFLNNGNIFSPSKSYPFIASLETNKWAIANFDISPLSQVLNPNTDDHYLRQCHVIPFYGRAINTVPTDDAFYIGRIIFYEDKPENIAHITGLLEKDANGNFRPSSLITRGEALSALVRILGMETTAQALNGESSYADVGKESKYNKYLLYLENAGVISVSDGESFYPDNSIKKRDFLELLYDCITKMKMNFSEDFSDLSINPYALINSEKYLTREDFLSIAVALKASNGGVETKIDSEIPDMNSHDEKTGMLLYLTEDCIASTSFASSKIVDTFNPVKATALKSSDIAAGAEYISQLDTLTAQRIDAIRSTESSYNSFSDSTIYYVSPSGNDTANDGKSINKPLKTLSKVNSLSLKPGDIVLFERGGVWRGQLTTVQGVTYSAYTADKPNPPTAKPEIWGSPEDLTIGNWTLFYSDITGKKIWKYSNEYLIDTGALFLINDNEVVTVAAKEIPNYVRSYIEDENGNLLSNPSDTPWRVRGNLAQAFDTVEQLDNDLEFVQYADSAFSLKTVDGDLRYYPSTSAMGEIYFRCDAGNPSTIYDDIELSPRKNGINAKSDVTIDNITIKYVGSHGIGAGTVNNLKITNCEIGWIGGGIQYYSADSGAALGRVTRYGNGVEIYGGLYNYTIDNCYIYEVYDAGITHQYSSGGTNNIYMENVDYTNNVIEYCIYNIEYFAGSADSGSAAIRKLKDILFENNILRKAGYGWGQQRPDPAPANIKGWSHNNLTDGYIIRNNIIDRSTHMLMQIGGTYFSSMPYLSGNTYVQHFGNTYAYFHSPLKNGGCVSYPYDYTLSDTMNMICEDGATVYYVPPIPWEHIYVYDKVNNRWE